MVPDDVSWSSKMSRRKSRQEQESERRTRALIGSSSSHSARWMLRSLNRLLSSTTRPQTYFTPSTTRLHLRRAYFQPSYSMSAPHPVESTATPANPAAEISAAATGAAPDAGASAAAAGGQQKQPKEKKAKKVAPGTSALELDPKPEFLASRIELFDQLKKEQDARIAGEFSLVAARPFSSCRSVFCSSPGAPSEQEEMY